MQQNKIKTIYTNYLRYTPDIQKQYKKSYSLDMKTSLFLKLILSSLRLWIILGSLLSNLQT
jgi:hypothetical protein